MLKRLRDRVQGRQEGFTLIELLVVILIIGILAAVAIPTFLSQTNKAYDSNVESSLTSAQTAAETYNTSNGGYPTSAITSASTSNPFTTIEPTLTTAFKTVANGGFNMSYTPTGTPVSSYVIAATDSKDNIVYSLTYTPGTGAISKTCALTGGGSAANQGDCGANGTWGG